MENEPKPKTFKFTITCETLGQISILKDHFSTNDRRVVYGVAAKVLGVASPNSDDLSDEGFGAFGALL
jgi:hypothetical protein